MLYKWRTTIYAADTTFKQHYMLRWYIFLKTDEARVPHTLYCINLCDENMLYMLYAELFSLIFLHCDAYYLTFDNYAFKLDLVHDVNITIVSIVHY